MQLMWRMKQTDRPFMSNLCRLRQNIFFFRLCVSAHLPEAEKIIGVRKTTMAFEVSDGMFSQKGSRGQILCENEKHIRAHIHAHNVRVFGSTVLLGFLHKSDPLITDDSFKN